MRNLCACGCGQPTRVPTNRFLHGHSVSPVSVGDRFGMLIVESRATSSKETKRWNCRCDCGLASVVPTQSLQTSNTRSCGCGSAQTQFGSRENNKNWKGDAGNKSNGRERARRWFPARPCEWPGCTVQIGERHHKDRNPLNNDPINIESLCHAHHMIADFAGIPKPQSMRDKIARTLRGRTLSQAHRANVSAGVRAWWASRRAGAHA